MAITLRDITADNWRDCARLTVAEHQRHFVASNAWSLAQSKYEPELVPLGIYDDETIVGFLMYCPEDFGIGKVWDIYRLMVGHEHQGKGYGRRGMELLIERLKTIPGYTGILISFVPDNDIARRLYDSLGFIDTGEMDDGEIVYRLPF